MRHNRLRDADNLSGTITLGLDSQRESACQGLIYSVLQRPQLSNGRHGFTAALVAAHPAAGTTHLTAVLAQLLNEDGAESALSLDCREMAALCGDPRTPPETFSRGSNGATALSSCPPAFQGSWRGSRAYRVAYLGELRERFAHVLIDCPSLKESTEVLGSSATGGWDSAGDRSQPNAEESSGLPGAHDRKCGWQDPRSSAQQTDLSHSWMGA